MPSTRKKSPASAAKKKTPATTKNKNSVKKSGKKKTVITVNDGSYLQSNNMEGVSSLIGVSTVTDNAVSHQCNQETTSVSTNQAILVRTAGSCQFYPFINTDFPATRSS